MRSVTRVLRGSYREPWFKTLNGRSQDTNNRAYALA